MAKQDDLPLGEETEDEPKAEISQKDLDALNERVATLGTELQAERARVEERVKAPEVKEPEKPVRYTREQIQELVDNGQATQAQAETYNAETMRESLKAEWDTELEAKLNVRDQQRVVQDQFDQYTAMRPDVKAEGTDDRRKFQEEYGALLKLGHPHDLRTEVAAMRSSFGPLTRVAETTRKRRETTRETGGAGDGPEPGRGGEKWEKGLSASQITSFRHQVSVGAYKGFDDPMFQRVTTRARTQHQQRKTG